MLVLFYGFSCNYGFHIKPNKHKVISTLIFSGLIIAIPLLSLTNIQ